MAGETTARCPICKSPATRESRPFCSERCRQIDLGQWLDGTYRVAGDRHEPPEGEKDS